MSLSVGKQLGPYRVLARLGSGGMGEVYRARDHRLDRDVAVKVLPEHLSGDASALERFEREAKVLAALSDPHIVAIFDVGTHQGSSFVVMELLEGETLRTRLDTAPMTWEAALEIAVSVARGLAAAHSKNVIHGDIKPENVFVTRAGLVKILDFGLAHIEAKRESDTDLATTVAASADVVAGTVPYMSPEQVRGLEADARSDLFSFGCLLHEMLTGYSPFRGDSRADVLAGILRDPLPEQPDMNFPASLYQVIRSCLHKNPDDRIQSARELVVALQSVLSGDTVPFVPHASPMSPTSSDQSVIDSIAILPFSVAPSATEIADYGEALTGRLIDTLSQLPGLRVMAWSTVQRYRGRQVDPRTVGRELSVRGVVSGAVERRDDTPVVRFELIDARDGAQIWGKLFDCDVSDLLQLQESLAREVTEQLRLNVLQAEKRRLLQRPTQNSEAFRLYLQGRYYWNKRSRDGLLRSLELFEESSQMDDGFALAHAGLADAYSLLGGFGYLPPKEAYTKSKQEAEHALELDASLAEAHSSLATVKYRFEWDWPAAEREFREAIRLNPGYANAHLWLGVYLTLMARFEEAFETIQRALDLDPLSLVANWTRGYTLYYMRRFNDALEQYRMTLGIDPTFARVHIDIGLVLVLRGDYAEGIDEIQKAMALLEDSPGLLASLGYAYAVSGDHQEAERILAELDTLSKRRAISPFTVALIHVGLKDPDAAFLWLERSFEQREDALVSLLVNPRLDPLRQDSRFLDLMQRVGLPLSDS